MMTCGTESCASCSEACSHCLFVRKDRAWAFPGPDLGRDWYDTRQLEVLHSLHAMVPAPGTAAVAGRPGPGTLVPLDNADYPEEREVLAHGWADRPELTCEVLAFEKGAARLLVPG